MEGFDLRKYQEEGVEQDKVKNILGKILSGREGYETVIEKKREIKRCKKCNWALEGGEKFCPECGEKTLECGVSNKNCEVVEKCD